MVEVNLILDILMDVADISFFVLMARSFIYLTAEALKTYEKIAYALLCGSALAWVTIYIVVKIIELFGVLA